MEDLNDSPEKEPAPPDVETIKALGQTSVLGEFIHDDFIDSLDRTMKYPEDAP